MKKNTKIILMIVLVVLFLIMDQALKIYCMQQKKEQKTETTSAVLLTYEESNKGAFGVGQNGTVTYIISTAIVLGVVVKFFFNQIERVDIGILVGISLVFAGGLSNMIDKIIHGFVVNCIQIFQLPAVNLSFILIVLGWIILAAVFAFSTWKEMRKKDA